jgi:hypothetical protein
MKPNINLKEMTDNVVKVIRNNRFILIYGALQAAALLGVMSLTKAVSPKLQEAVRMSGNKVSKFSPELEASRDCYVLDTAVDKSLVLEVYPDGLFSIPRRYDLGGIPAFKSVDCAAADSGVVAYNEACNLRLQAFNDIVKKSPVIDSLLKASPNIKCNIWSKRDGAVPMPGAH